MIRQLLSRPLRAGEDAANEGSPGIDIVLHLDRFDCIAEHLLLDLAIGHCKSVMLSLVLGPGINLEALQIGIPSFSISEDPQLIAPSRRRTR